MRAARPTSIIDVFTIYAEWGCLSIGGSGAQTFGKRQVACTNSWIVLRIFSYLLLFLGGCRPPDPPHFQLKVGGSGGQRPPRESYFRKISQMEIRRIQDLVQATYHFPRLARLVCFGNLRGRETTPESVHPSSINLHQVVSIFIHHCSSSFTTQPSPPTSAIKCHQPQSTFINRHQSSPIVIKRP